MNLALLPSSALSPLDSLMNSGREHHKRILDLHPYLTMILATALGWTAVTMTRIWTPGLRMAIR
jgi:hypothetical protein